MIEKMKVVHIVTTESEKTSLLDRLRSLGIVHFSEKAGRPEVPRALRGSEPHDHSPAGVSRPAEGGPAVRRGI